MKLRNNIFFCVCLSWLSTVTTAAVPALDSGGITLADMDPSVKPGNDFFRYSNGGWLKTAVIPPNRVAAGVNLELDMLNEERLQGIVATLSSRAGTALTDEERKLRDLYRAFEDTSTIEANDLSPVQRELDQIAALRSYRDVATFMGNPATQIGGPFQIDFTKDDKNPDAYAVELLQYGLGMPDRDYYLGTDQSSVATQQAYKTFLATMLGFAGIHDAARSAAVYALEEKIARVHWPAADRREADKVYNPMTMRVLAHFAPQFPWEEFFRATGVSNQSPKGERSVLIREKSAFPKLAAIFASTPVSVWRDYLTAHYLRAYASCLPKRIDDANFAFYGVVINGQTTQLSRPLRGVHLLDDDMGEALGKLYVAQYFSPQAKAKAQALVANLLKAYEIDLQSLPWMTAATREKALDKIHHMSVMVGYPDKWRDYSALTIKPGLLIQDVINAEVFDWNRQLQRLDQPVDRAEWEMTPATNDAYNEPTLNQIVFPAGILQAPFFDLNADDAVNYGEIGATIGHEISHGFDDQGSKYDATGRLRNWWTAEDRKQFDARTAALVRQFDQYQPLSDLHINGQLTLGENIADLAGLEIAHKAYHLSLGSKTAPVLDGFSGDQRFYIAYGQSWREIWTDARIKRVVLSDPHSPSAFRVNGVVRNDAGWYAAFPQVQVGDNYYLPPEQRVSLW